MYNNNNSHYKLIVFLIFLVLLLIICISILIEDNFIISQSISEFLDLNKELHEKFEHLEMIQQQKIKNLENTVNKNLEEIAINQKLLNKKIHEPTPTEWVFVFGTLALCFYVIIKLGFTK
jgi:hypothetical protein